jgi:hypothetical protein
LSNEISKPLRIILSLWIPVWIFYWIWPVVKKPERLRTTVALLREDADGRRAIAFGENFYRFLQFCKQKLPAHSAFRLVGVDDASIDRVRAIYYLYPCVASSSPEYILVYENATYREENADLHALLTPTQFILKKSPNRSP